MGLSTHVLDQVSGEPAAGMTVRVYLDNTKIAEAKTDNDGRCSDLLEGRDIAPGEYRLEFETGAYLLDRELITETPFFSLVPICFNLERKLDRLHVPLLLSPFGYATYRGS